MAVITSNVISSAVSEFYDRAHLEVARPMLTYAKWSTKKRLKKGHGKQIKFRRPVPFDPATTPLTEGLTPQGRSFEYQEVTGTVDFFGDWASLSDVIQVIEPDPILTDIVTEFGEQEALTINTLMRNKLMTGTNAYFASNVANREAVKDSIKVADIKAMRLALKKAKTKPLTKMMNASTGISTTPIEACYIALVSLEVASDLRDLESSGFVPVHKYASQTGILEGEIGKLDGIRFIETTEAPVWKGAGTTPASGVVGTGGATDVHGVIVFGANAYAEIPLESLNSGIIIKAGNLKDTNDKSDPLNQRSTVGWKLAWGGVILNDDWIIRYECGSTR
ncbi:MAG: N4-gp56 family major capsid protein [Spirochaetia bacterium]|nr:N4-gp56 family major capsid protein [Spirochaetia bacterium]